MGETESDSIILGIDLGTSRTVMMSDRGASYMVDSVVGYPKDIIALKLIGDTSLIGAEALTSRAQLELYQPLEEGVIKEASEKDIEAVKMLLRHVVKQAEPRARDKVCGIIGVPARASIANKEMLLNIAKDILDVALVVSEPFMVAYDQDALANSIVIDIGAGTTDICAMKGTLPSDDDQVTLNKGGDYIDKVLATTISQRYPEVQMTKHLAKNIKEQFAFVGEPQREIEVELREAGKPVVRNLTEAVRVSCETIIPPIVENIQKLIATFDPENQAEVTQNIILAGGGSHIEGLAQMLADELSDYGDVVVSSVESPEYSGCQGALKLGNDLPPQYWDQIGGLIGSAD